MDEGRVGREGDVAALYELDDFVLLAVVFQLHVLGVEIEGGIGVVVEVHIDLVTDLSRHVEVDLLVEVESSLLSASHRQRGVVNIGIGAAELQLRGALGAQTDAAGSEDLLRRSQVEMHIGEVKLLLALSLIDFTVFAPEESVAPVFLAPLHILLRCHHDGRREPCVTDFSTNDIPIDGVVVGDLIFQTVGPCEVHGILFEVVVGDRGSALHFPPCCLRSIGRRSHRFFSPWH